MSRTPAERVADAGRHLQVLHEHLERGDMRDDIVFDAVCMRLAAAIESLGAIEEGLRDEAFGTSWPVIWGVRNRIAHGYVALDRTIIISTVDYDLAEFEESVGRLAAIVGR